MIRPVQKDLYAVIGNPVVHSLSPLMMNAVFEALGIPALYLALQVDDLAEDLPLLARVGIKGLSVTIPHKEAAFRLAALTDEPARAMGAVNTLRLRGSRWEGCNTDWLGALTALQQVLGRPEETTSIAAYPPEASNLATPAPSAPHASRLTPHSLKECRVLLIGAGGVARAVGYGLKREGAVVSVTNRGTARGEALAQALNGEFFLLSELGKQNRGTTFQVLVQCTSVGLLDDMEFTLIPDSLFQPGTVAMDTVYRPLWTPFLRKARAAGCTTVTGVEMLLHQGIAQLGWWFGELIRPEVVLPIMRTALLGILADEKEHQAPSKGA